MEKTRIGIQFNFTQKTDFREWINNKRDRNLEADDHHVSFYFSEGELEDLQKSNGQPSKTEEMKLVLKKYLAYSDYTNIYTYLDATSLENQKRGLFESEFKSAIRVQNEFENKEVIVGNYKGLINSDEVKNIITSNKIMPVMNNLFHFVVNRDFELEQILTLEIGLEDKDDWGTDLDVLNISIQFENF